MEDEPKDFKERALRRVKEGLGRLVRRRSVTITEYDPSFKVLYLGNVLTGWAKGDGCVEKPLSTLWANYRSSGRPDVHMKVSVGQSGLKAVTKEHGLTEYWAHRLTFCAAPAGFPGLFCWVYRHEGRRLRQELRCHAVLCNKESTARRMASELSLRLSQALLEFKRDKLSRQNARLSLANSLYENPSLPRRKILLSTGSSNYRPPLERSKSAPKLMSIEERAEEEEEAESNAAPSGRRRGILRRAETVIQDDPFVSGIHLPGVFDFPPVSPEEELEERNMRLRWDDESSLIGGPEVLSLPHLALGKQPDPTTILDHFTDLYSSDIIDYLEEESTPSLQSISSGSGGGGGGGGVGRYDLSEEEEDSDESGFVEAAIAGGSIGGCSTGHSLACNGTGDDKSRDLPHHHLVSPRLASSTHSASLQV